MIEAKKEEKKLQKEEGRGHILILRCWFALKYLQVWLQAEYEEEERMRRERQEAQATPTTGQRNAQGVPAGSSTDVVGRKGGQTGSAALRQRDQGMQEYQQELRKRLQAHQQQQDPLAQQQALAAQGRVGPHVEQHNVSAASSGRGAGGGPDDRKSLAEGKKSSQTDKKCVVM